MRQQITKKTVSLKFFEENMIRNEMGRCEKLISLLESRDFALEYFVARKWFDDRIDSLIKECKAHLIKCAEDLSKSKNYQ
jgi:hypothetical protein